MAVTSPIPAQDQVDKAKESLKSFFNLKITRLREIQRSTLLNNLRILEYNIKLTAISNMRDCRRRGLARAQVYCNRDTI